MAVVVPVASADAERQFVDFPFALYADDAHWVPPLRRDELRRISPRNPFLAHAAMKLWVAKDGGRITGRVAAVNDRLHDATHQERVTWFGFFEAADQASANQLLEVVESHGREVGSRILRGPVNPSLNESAGLLVNGFDEDPAVMMPYNPPHYADWVEGAGYRKVKDLLAWHLVLGTKPADRLTRIADRVARRSGLQIRRVRLEAFDDELQTLRRIYESAWKDNWGFVPPTEEEMRYLAADLRPVVDPDLVLFIEQDGKAVACVVAIPDMNQVLKRMRGRLWPFGFVHFLRRRAIIDRARVLLLGVDPGARLTGLYPLLIAEIQRRGIARGYRSAELSWTLDDNDAINAGIEAAGGRRSKTYRLYEKPLG